MKLQSLDIQLQPSYSENPGKYIATVNYDLRAGNTTRLVLDADLSEKIMKFIGPVITAACTRVAKELEVDLQQSITEANKAQVLEVTNE